MPVPVPVPVLVVRLMCPLQLPGLAIAALVKEVPPIHAQSPLQGGGNPPMVKWTPAARRWWPTMPRLLCRRTPILPPSTPTALVLV